MDEISNSGGYHFGDFTLDLDRAALSRGGGEVRLRPRTFDVLAYLVRNAGRLIPKQELFEAVWGDVARSNVCSRVAVNRCLPPVHWPDSARSVSTRGPTFSQTGRVRGARSCRLGAACATYFCTVRRAIPNSRAT